MEFSETRKVSSLGKQLIGKHWWYSLLYNNHTLYTAAIAMVGKATALGEGITKRDALHYATEKKAVVALNIMLLAIDACPGNRGSYGYYNFVRPVFTTPYPDFIGTRPHFSSRSRFG